MERVAREKATCLWKKGLRLEQGPFDKNIPFCILNHSEFQFSLCFSSCWSWHKGVRRWLNKQIGQKKIFEKTREGPHFLGFLAGWCKFCLPPKSLSSGYINVSVEWFGWFHTKRAVVCFSWLHMSNWCLRDHTGVRWFPSLLPPKHKQHRRRSGNVFWRTSAFISVNIFYFNRRMCTFIFLDIMS